MNKRPFIFALLIAPMLSGCAYKSLYHAVTDTGDFFPIAKVDMPYDSATQARVRHYGGYLTPASQCYGSNPDIGRNIKRSLLSTQILLTGVAAESTSVGIARPNIRNKSVFDELVVPAGQPLAVRNLYNLYVRDGTTGVARSESCDPGGVFFVPVAGHDYETFLVGGANACRIEVREIAVDLNGNYGTAPVQTKDAFRCREEAVRPDLEASAPPLN
jgi:hypothetical protein